MERAVVDTLRLDTSALRSAARSLYVISAEFVGAETYAQEVGDVVGHAGLAERLREFAEGWRIRRGEIEATVVGLAEVLMTTVNSFEGIDAELASNVRGSSSNPSGAAS